MASDTESNSGLPEHGQNALTLSLSMLAGGGVVLMMFAAGIGVIQGGSDLVNLMFAAGLGMFVAGTAGWAGVVRPWEDFDDINVGIYEGHAHNDHEEPGEVDAEQPVLPESTAPTHERH